MVQPWCAGDSFVSDDNVISKSLEGGTHESNLDLGGLLCARPWCRAGLQQCTDGAFAPLIDAADHDGIEHDRLFSRDRIADAIRQPHARRGLRHKPGALLRYLRREGSAANARAVSAAHRRTDGIRAGPAGIPGRTLVGGSERRWHSGCRRSLFPLPALTSGPDGTIGADVDAAPSCTAPHLQTSARPRQFESKGMRMNCRALIGLIAIVWLTSAPAAAQSDQRVFVGGLFGVS